MKRTKTITLDVETIYHAANALEMLECDECQEAREQIMAALIEANRREFLEETTLGKCWYCDERATDARATLGLTVGVCEFHSSDERARARLNGWAN